MRFMVRREWPIPRIASSQRRDKKIANSAMFLKSAPMPSGLAKFVDSPVRTISLVDEILRREALAFHSTSPPGHLLHLVLSGEVQQTVDGRRQELRRGDFVWYHQMETCRGVIRKAPWRFVSINFIAPDLPPPDEQGRVFSSDSESRAIVRKLLAAWRKSPSLARSFETSALLNKLLHRLLPERLAAMDGSGDVEAWWRIERQLRTDLSAIPSLPVLARRSGLSLRSLTRACRQATGQPPARRIKILRILFARQLLQLTTHSMTEIAFRTGYGRSQELSRDMRKLTSQSPRQVRAASPDHRSLEKS